MSSNPAFIFVTMGLTVNALVLLALLSPAASLRRGKTDRSESNLFFHRRRRSASPYVSLDWKQHFNAYTSDLSRTANPKGMMQKCEPYVAEPSGTSRGLMILQHGFTACAGFWYLLAPRLVAAGWTVAVPNLPGHGRTATVKSNGTRSYEVSEYLEDLPERGSEYEAFSRELIEIARKYKDSNSGKKLVLAGCSHGGAVAIHMAMNGEVGTWDRILLMNPFLAPPTSLGADYGLSFLRKLVPQALPLFKPVTGDFVSWGPECETARWPGDVRKAGHGGICQFDLRNFRAVLEFGNLVEGEARTRAAKLGVFTGGVVDRTIGMAQLLTHSAWQLVTGGGDPPPTKLVVQMVTTSNDGAISNARVHFAAAAISKSVLGQQSGYCSFDKEFEHTYINPIDKGVNVDLWWLDPSRVVGGKGVLELFEEFLTAGTLIPTDGTIQDDKFIKGDPRCFCNKRR